MTPVCPPLRRAEIIAVGSEMLQADKTDTNKLNESMAKHTGKAVEQIARDTDRDNFLSGDEAMQYGLVDRILTSRTEATAG